MPIIYKCYILFSKQSHYNINISLTVDVVAYMLIFESMVTVKSIIILKSQSFETKLCAVAIRG